MGEHLGHVTRAANTCENIAGFTPYQWAQGHSDGDVPESERMYRHGLSGRDAKDDWATLTRHRQDAEGYYRRAKALERLSILKNSKVRQPIKEYAIGDLVYVWRRQTSDVNAKTRSSFKKSMNLVGSVLDLWCLA